MVGQKHIKRTLKNAVATDQVAHAYLFSGPRGTGKTTTARILAAALLCEHPADGDPDGSCEQCREVATGAHPDVIELDAASRTGVDNVRDEIIARVQFAPVRGRSKIYIIDEVHMLSTGAFNAFLKTLEEPPDHVVFILCTTDPQKVPETIRSRCQQFEFRPYTVEELSEELQRIGAAEKITAEPAALALIAARARGGMRDAITAYEQLAAFTNNDITAGAVEATLGGTDSASLAALVRAVATADAPACFTWVAEQVGKGADLPEAVHGFIDYVRDLYVLAALGSDAGVIDRNEAELARMTELVAQFNGPEQLARMLDLLAELSAALRWANEPRTLLELALVRMTRPESDLSLAALSQRLEAVERRLSQSPIIPNQSPVAAVAVPANNGASLTGNPATSATTPGTDAGRTVPGAPPAGDVPPVSPAPAPPAGRDPSARHCEEQSDAAIQSAGMTPAAPPAPASGVATSTAADAARLWREVLAAIKLTARSRYTLFAEAQLEPDTTGGESGYVLSFNPGATFALKASKEADNVALLRDTFKQLTGQTPALRFVMRDKPQFAGMPEVTINDIEESDLSSTDFEEQPTVDDESPEELEADMSAPTYFNPAPESPELQEAPAPQASQESPELQPSAADAQDGAAPSAAAASIDLTLEESPTPLDRGAATPPKEMNAIFDALGALPVATPSTMPLAAASASFGDAPGADPLDFDAEGDDAEAGETMAAFEYDNLDAPDEASEE